MLGDYIRGLRGFIVHLTHFSALSAPIFFTETGVGVRRPAPFVGLFL